MTIYRFTFGGKLGGAQRWSVGITCGSAGTPGTPTAAELGTLCNQLQTDFNSTAWNGTQTGSYAWSLAASSAANFDQVRGYFYAGTASPALIVGQSTGAAVAGGGSPNLPTQNAIVVSLLTGLAGRSNRGRMYIPNRTVIVDATGNFPTATASGLAIATANFLSLLRTRTIAGANLVPIVGGRTSQASITACAVDTVVDTQRRRRDKIVATARPIANLIVG